MPVVNLKSDLFKTQPLLGEATPDPARARGRGVVVQGTIANGASDSALSTYLLAELPSDCILGFNTWFRVDGWGFANINVGTKASIGALVNNVAKAAGTYIEPVVRGDSKHGLALWEVLGLAKDPGGTIALYAQGPANATGAGSMKFEISYRYR